MIEIEIKNIKTIKDPILIELENFTVFAGENNSGKTQIVEFLKKI